MALADFPLLNFQQANPWLTGFGAGQDIVGQNLQQQLQRMQLQYQPQMFQQDILQKQLANQLSQGTMPSDISLAQQKARMFMPDAQSEIALRRAQSGLAGSEEAKNQFMMRNPEFLSGGMAAQLGALDLMQKNNPSLFDQQNSGSQGNPLDPANSALPGLGGTSQSQGGSSNSLSGLRDAILNSWKGQMSLPAAKAAEANQRVNGAGYLDLPPDSKRMVLGQARAFGFPDDVAVQRLVKGDTLDTLAKEKGYSPDRSTWPEVQNLPTIATMSRTQQRNTGNAELDAVAPFMTESLGPYSQTIQNYSPKQVIDSFNSMTSGVPESQGKHQQLQKFLAARIVQPEYNAVRARTMGVQNIGIDAMKSIGEKSMNDFKIFQGLVSPQDYMAAQNLANEQIRKMNSAANRATSRPFQSGINNFQQDQAGSPSDISTGMARVQAPDGTILRLSPENAERLIKDHPDHKRIG